MPKVPESIPVSDLRRGFSEVLENLSKPSGPLIVTDQGREAAVLVGIEAYRKSEHERQLLLLFARGEREIAAGVGAELEEVLREIDDILAEEPSQASNSRTS